jgi:hypothetical protein
MGKMGYFIWVFKKVNKEKLGVKESLVDIYQPMSGRFSQKGLGTSRNMLR